MAIQKLNKNRVGVEMVKIRKKGLISLISKELLFNKPSQKWARYTNKQFYFLKKYK